jgi:hypothetical protein
MCPTSQGWGHFQGKFSLFWHTNESIKPKIRFGMTILRTGVWSLSSTSIFGKSTAATTTRLEIVSKAAFRWLDWVRSASSGTVAFAVMWSCCACHRQRRSQEIFAEQS